MDERYTSGLVQYFITYIRNFKIKKHLTEYERRSVRRDYLRATRKVDKKTHKHFTHYCICRVLAGRYSVSFRTIRRITEE